MRITAAGQLRISLNQRVLLLDPTAQQPAVLSGRVHVKLQAPSAVNITVRLRGVATVCKTTMPVFEVAAQLGQEQCLAPGEHEFDFHLEVPQQVAPTEGCEQGTVGYTVSATAPGLGALGKDARVDAAVLVHTMPRDMGAGWQAFESRAELDMPGLGPVRIGAFSFALAISATLMVDVRILEPPSAQTVEVVVSIVQRVAIAPVYRQRDYSPRDTDENTFRLRVAHLPIAPGQPARLRELMRLPRAAKGAIYEDRRTWSPLRPTTLPDTETPLRVSHEVRRPRPMTLTLAAADRDCSRRLHWGSESHALAERCADRSRQSNRPTPRADETQCSLVDATVELPEYSSVDECATWRLHDTEWGVGTAAGPLFCSCELDDATVLAVCVLHTT